MCIKTTPSPNSQLDPFIQSIKFFCLLHCLLSRFAVPYIIIVGVASVERYVFSLSTDGTVQQRTGHNDWRGL
jgi:hypothetical protein